MSRIVVASGLEVLRDTADCCAKMMHKAESWAKLSVAQYLCCLLHIIEPLDLGVLILVSSILDDRV
jgi:hypothetical protein